MGDRGILLAHTLLPLPCRVKFSGGIDNIKRAVAAAGATVILNHTMLMTSMELDLRRPRGRCRDNYNAMDREVHVANCIPA